jgi:hypothetical protein
MSNRDHTPPETLLLEAAIRALHSSPYRNSEREIQKAWVIGWLISQLTQEYRHSYDLKRRISRILD